MAARVAAVAVDGDARAVESLRSLAIDDAGLLVAGAQDVVDGCLARISSVEGAGLAGLWGILAETARAANRFGGDVRVRTDVQRRLEEGAVPAAGFVLGATASDPGVREAMECLRWILGFVWEPQSISKLLRKFARMGPEQKQLAREVREGPDQ